MTQESQKASLWSFFTVLCASSLNLLAFGFLTIYHNVGRTMFKGLSQAWIFLPFIMVGILIAGLFVDKKSNKAEDLEKLCSFALGTVKVLSYITFAGSLFILAKYLLTHWNERGVFYALLTQCETALVGLFISVIFLRFGWKVTSDSTQETITERFEFFLFSWKREYATGSPSPRGPLVGVLVLLGAFSFLPPIVHYKTIGQKEVGMVKSEAYKHYSDKFNVIQKLEAKHWNAGKELSSTDVERLLEAMDAYQELEKELESATYPPKWTATPSNCRLGQARILIRLGHYDRAMPILARHRQDDTDKWNLIGKMHTQGSRMLEDQFVLAYWKNGDVDKAIQLRYVALRKDEIPVSQGDYLLALLLIADKQWGEASRECKGRKSHKQVVKNPDWDLARRKIEDRDSDVKGSLESLCYKKREF